MIPSRWPLVLTFLQGVTVKHHHIYVLSFMTPLALGALAWWKLGEPDHQGGLGIAIGVCVFAWPLVAMLFWSLPSLLVGATASPRERAARRKRLKDAGHPRSAPIRSWVRRAAFRADRYRCVYCHVKIKGQTGWRTMAIGHMLTSLSHIFNIFALCKYHNDVKSDYWVDAWDGYVHYHPYLYSNIQMAAGILAAERRHRRNPVRWLRAAWSLAW